MAAEISDLPDDILVSILSFLPIGQAARCSVLASRWPRIFPRTLIRFRASLSTRRHGAIDIVNSILAAHPTAPVRYFSIASICFRGDENPSAGGWLQELALRGVQEINLSFREMRHMIPASLFACTSLTRLKISNCTFPDARAAAAAGGGVRLFPRLAEIDLYDVVLPSDSLHALLSHCTALEHLKMCKMHGCRRIHVRSPSLRFLCSDGLFDELFIDDAPKLEWVLGYDMCCFYKPTTTRLTIVHAPKLGFLGYLGVGSPAIQIGDRIIVRTLMPNLKTLAVRLKNMSRAGEVKRFMQLLELFPNLETLYIQAYRGLWFVKQDAAASWDDLRLAPCVHNHLERVVFEDYSGHGWQLQMAKFLHGNSRFLETLEFHCIDVGTRRPPSPDWVRKQRELLCLDSRASRDARFLFFKHMLATHHHVSCHQESYERKYHDNLYEI